MANGRRTELPINQIICGDCLEVMREWPDKCVDLVFTSPPYEDVRTYGIDFMLKGQEWVDWMVSRVIESLRICKGLVAFVVEGKTRGFRWSGTPALLMADLHRAGIHLRKPPAFHKVGIPGSGGPDWLRNDYEFIVCCTNGGKLPWSDNKAMGRPCKYAPGGEMSYRLSDGTRRNQWGGSAKSTGGERQKDGSVKQAKPKPSHRFITKKKFAASKRRHTKRRANGEMEEQYYAPPEIANPGNVIHCKVGKGHMGDDLAHKNEAPFPESLAEFFVRSFCPPSGIAMDPFCGSGTTLTVAQKWGRKWIGIDIRTTQVDLAGKRLDQGKTLFTDKE
jgi:site-specific DNA-methyltransferase (cytosine-N4-specific)